MIGTRGRLVIGLAVLALVLAACGSSDSGSGDTTTTKAKTTDSTAKKKGPAATATPTTGLTNGQAVTVSGTGFTEGKQIGVNECADTAGTTAGASDCDLENIVLMTIGADGTGTATINVKNAGIGQAQHTCGGETRCFLSVGELVESGGERAEDIDLTFG